MAHIDIIILAFLSEFKMIGSVTLTWQDSMHGTHDAIGFKMDSEYNHGQLSFKDFFN